MNRLLLLPLTAALVWAGEYKDADRQSAIALLETSRQSVAIVLENMSAEQSNFTPDGKMWSVTSVLEHLTLMEDLLMGFLVKTLDGEPVPDTQKLPDPSKMDHQVQTAVSDRTQKAQAPEQAVPKGNYRDREEAFTQFSIKRAKTVEFLQKNKKDLRRYQFDSPMGKLDGQQWVILMAAHTERHMKQIEEMKKHEQFPK